MKKTILAVLVTALVLVGAFVCLDRMGVNVGLKANVYGTSSQKDDAHDDSDIHDNGAAHEDDSNSDDVAEEINDSEISR